MGGREKRCEIGEGWRNYEVNIFEINKGGNKNPSIDVNAYIDKSDRRIPIDRTKIATAIIQRDT